MFGLRNHKPTRLATTGALSSLLVLVTACGPGFMAGDDAFVDSGSDIKSITRDSFRCDVIQNRVGNISSRYGQYIQGGNQQAAFNALSVLPDEYLEFTFTRFATPITMQGAGSGGICYFGSTTIDGKWVREPDRISSSPGALVHEMGHANAGVLQLRSSDFNNARDTTYRQAVTTGAETSHMGSYAQTEAEEMFAEAFASYYCSQSARDYMQQHMPTVYQFASQNFLPPLDPNGTAINTGGGGFGGGVNPASVGIYMAMEPQPPMAAAYKPNYHVVFSADNHVAASSMQYCFGDKVQQCGALGAWQPVVSVGTLPNGRLVYRTQTRQQFVSTHLIHVRANSQSTGALQVSASITGASVIGW